MNQLMQWNPSGFSLYAEQLVSEQEPQRLEKLARYLTRAPIRVDGVNETQDHRVSLTTAPHPLTGQTLLLVDPLDWLPAICQQIPDRGQHLTRFYGAYANRIRNALLKHQVPQNGSAHSQQTVEGQSPSAPSRTSRASWARLIRKVLEVDPFICPRRGTEMKLISVLTEPKVVDKILRHLQETTSERAPPKPPSTDLSSVLASS